MFQVRQIFVLKLYKYESTKPSELTEYTVCKKYVMVLFQQRRLTVCVTLVNV